MKLCRFGKTKIISYLYVTQDGRATVRTFNFYISDWNEANDCATLFRVHTYT